MSISRTDHSVLPLPTHVWRTSQGSHVLETYQFGKHREKSVFVLLFFPFFALVRHCLLLHHAVNVSFMYVSRSAVLNEHPWSSGIAVSRTDHSVLFKQLAIALLLRQSCPE